MGELRTHISKKIKELRTGEGWTQTELARRMAVTPNTVSRWESGEYQPTLDVLEALARVFERPIWALLPRDLQPDGASEQQRTLLSATGDLPDEDIQELMRYADFVRARHALRKKSKRK